jgi:hypothetical protein
LFVIDFVFVYYMLPESSQAKAVVNIGNIYIVTNKQISPAPTKLSLATISQVFNSQDVGSLLLTHFFTQFAFQLFRSNFPIYTQVP